MRPIFRILADDKDVTAAVNDRLLDLSVSDEVGIKSDKLTLTLDDRPRPDGAMPALPRMGTKLAVSLGYAETELANMGSYVVNALDISNAPATLKVTAHAADMVGPFRSPKTRSWDSTTLGGMVETIAGEHGYTPKVDPQLASIAIPHIDQRAESDMALLTRLAETHDATAKPVNGSLILARQGAAVSAGGQPLPPITLHARDITTWEYHQESRSPGGESGESKEGGDNTGKGGYRAEWWDFNAGITRTVTVGKDPFEDIRGRFDSEAKAKAAAAAKFNKGKRQEKKLTLTLPGNPLVAAEHRLHLPDLRPNLPTDWRVTKAEHSMAGKGYVTRVECELFLEQQAEVVGVPTAKKGMPSMPEIPDTPGGGGNENLTPEEEEARREEIFASLTDGKDKIIRCLPEIANAEYARANDRDKIGWAYFHDLITKWLHGKGKAMPDDNKHSGWQEPYFVDWNWLMQYERFSESTEKLLKKDNLFSPDALANLNRFLTNDGAFKNGGQPFDYINLPAEQQRQRAIQGEPLSFKLFETVVENHPTKPDGLQAVVAQTTIYALAAGYTKVDPNGDKSVIINKIAFFIHDGFDFNGDQWLGGWICTEKDTSFSLSDIWLYNDDFRTFRQRTGYGRDFRTMSIPEVVWTGKFEYAIK